MTIVYLSDFDMSHSGYQVIAANLCSELVGREYDVQVLGLSYKREEHLYPFSIVPARLKDFASMTKYLWNSGMEIEMVICALDIPLQIRVLKQFQLPNPDVGLIGLFPVESIPLMTPWALELSRLDARLVMSKFGLASLEAEGLDGVHVPIGIDEQWRPPSEDEHKAIRQNMNWTGKFVVLTVADNQERKNLARSLEIFAGFTRKIPEAIYAIVTRPNSPIGWNIPDYAQRLGIYDKVQIWDRGMPYKNLWALFAGADAFLLTSKAEGLAMPVMESMRVRLPVAGTNCTAIAEHLNDGRGLLIRPDYTFVDPWGNSLRHMAGTKNGINQLYRLATMSKKKLATMMDKAQTYALEHSWARTADVVIDTIEQVKKDREGLYVKEAPKAPEPTPA